MRGTPTTVLIDAQGARLRRQVFGAHDDLLLGAELQTLLLEAAWTSTPKRGATSIAASLKPALSLGTSTALLSALWRL
jgi:hypothetical protein